MNRTAVAALGMLLVLDSSAFAAPEQSAYAVWSAHSDEVSDVVFLPGGETVLSACADQTFRLFKIPDGTVLDLWQAETEDLSVAVLMPDGRSVLSAGRGHTVKRRTLADGRVRATWTGHKDTVQTIAVSPDGRLAATVTYVGVLSLWDTASGERISVLQKGPLATALDAAFSPDGKTLLEARWDKTVRVWDVASQKITGVLRGHLGKVTAVRFLPDGKRALSAGWDNTLRLWDVPGGKEIALWRAHRSRVKTVEISPDGRFALSGGRDKDVIYWDIRTGKPLAIFKGHTDHVNAVSFSPDGTWAVSAGNDQTIRLWDLTRTRGKKAPSTNASLPILPEGSGSPQERLGRLLFFDERLSGDDSRKCSFCHMPRKAYTDGRDLSLSYLDTLYFRNTPTLFNAGEKSLLYWDGRFSGDDLPTLIRDHISEAHFMNADGRLVVEKLRQTPGYVAAFQKVYGEDPKYGKILAALSAFIRSIKSGESSYDRDQKGEPGALSSEERRGMDIFTGRGGCAKCHKPPLFTDGKLHARGVPPNQTFFDDPLRRISFRRFFRMSGLDGYAELKDDPGLYAVTKEEKDRGKFRTPSLREVGDTAPYMHNGVFKTLEEAVAFEGSALTPQERSDVAAFLRALSSPKETLDPPARLPYTARPRRPKPPTGFAQEPPDTGSFPPLAALGPVPVPSDNPATEAKAELGKKLFFDQRISGNAETYCITCHEPGLGWGDAAALSEGYEGILHWRNSQTLLNAAYYRKLNWDGNSPSLEEQARSAILSNLSGNGDPIMIEERLAEVPEYVERFRAVFGTKRPRFEGVLKAIATFLRTGPISVNTPFDRFARGETSALSDAAKRGKSIFEGKAGCIRCHNGALVSDQGFHATGVPENPQMEEDPLRQIAARYVHVARGVSEEIYRKAEYDPGLFLVTLREEDRGKFRTPSLRELTHTAPYMHNGSIETLEQVVDFYNRGGGETPNKSPKLRPRGLAPAEKSDLIAFLRSLSGKEIIIETPVEAGEHYTTTGYAPGEH